MLLLSVTRYPAMIRLSALCLLAPLATAAADPSPERARELVRMVRQH